MPQNSEKAWRLGTLAEAGDVVRRCVLGRQRYDIVLERANKRRAGTCLKTYKWGWVLAKVFEVYK